MRGQVLGGDKNIILSVTFSRVMSISTRADVSTAPSIEQSIMASGRGKSRDFIGGRATFGGSRGSYGSRQTVGDKKPRQCKYCERNNHISEKCCEKFDRPEWALVDIDTTPSDIAYVSAPSATHSDTSESPAVVLSQEEHDRLCQFEFSQNNQSATHASFSDMSAYIAYPQALDIRFRSLIPHDRY